MCVLYRRQFRAALAAAGVRPYTLTRNRWGEKGVDTALALEMQKAVITERIDVVLLATDGDFVPVSWAVRQAVGRIVLLGFHLPAARPQAVNVSLELTDAVDLVVPVSDLMSESWRWQDPGLRQLFHRPGREAAVAVPLGCWEAGSRSARLGTDALRGATDGERGKRVAGCGECVAAEPG